jgi:magnesium chelatase family protein
VLAIVPSATLHGLEGRLIRVEVDVAPGLPGFTIVGLADAALLEARERVRGALRNAGFVYPPRRITVNLAPADLRKAGASVDLAIAIGILLGSEQVRPGPGRVALIGELSLGGEVRPVPGVLPMVAALKRRGIRRVVVASVAVPEARLVEGIEVHGVDALSGAVELVRARRPRRPAMVPPRVELTERQGSTDREAPIEVVAEGRRVPDLAEVRGQPEARRGLEIALAGRHGLLVLGPPGSGKTLLARTIPGLLPLLDDAAALAVTVVASAAGDGPIHELRRRPPFRAPHHTISYAAMVGGGPRLSPGEITRADHTVC